MSEQTTINTVTGTITPDALGKTLMHEHLLVGYPGWESDTLRAGPSDQDMVAICTDRIEEMKAQGITAMLDPCPSDLGRDVELMAKVAQKTDFTIVCATGLYKEDEGGAAYWKFRSNLGAGPESIAEVYIHEITEGIRGTGIKPGIIKVATGHGTISDYERMLLEAAAMASVETGTPVTTHTDQGTLGDEQQKILTDLGVPAHRIIIGHSCGSDDLAYHLDIVEEGSYLGFDRFGLEVLQPDEVRVRSLVNVINAGAVSRIVVSHDTVWCWRGAPVPDPAMLAQMNEIWTPTHFIERIVPMLRDEGATDDDIRMMLEENPRRFFAGEEPPEVS